MYIQEFSVVGFRSLANVQVRDLRPVILLFGHNGSGKSNVLAALDAVFAPKQVPPDVAGAPTLSGPFYRGWLPDFQNNYPRNVPTQVAFEVTLRTTEDELRRLWPSGLDAGVLVLPVELPPDRVRIRFSGRFQPVPESPSTAEMVLESATVVDTLVYSNAQVSAPWFPTAQTALSLDERAAVGDALLARLTGLFSNIGVARSLRRESSPWTQQDSTNYEDLQSSFKRRLFGLKYSSVQEDQNKYRHIQGLFRTVAGWGEIDFAQSGGDSDELDIMTWDDTQLWLPIARRGAGAEQLLVILSEVLLRGSTIIGIEELESNLDEDNQKKLYGLLEQLVSQPDSGVGQIVATAHSFFYGGELLPHEKRFVHVAEPGVSVVEPWSNEAHRALFRPHDYYEERQQHHAAQATTRRQSGGRSSRTGG